MYAQLRSDNIIVADTTPAHMHSTLINEYMALKRSGYFSLHISPVFRL